jgi:U3 small nucleolar RNA-associated protein 4
VPGPQKLYPTQSGTLWSLAPNSAQTLLALGCADGSIRLLSLSDDTDLVHFRRFERTKARLLSIAWGPPTKPAKKAVAAPSGGSDSDDSDDDEAEQWADSWLVTGCSDSCLRKWDFRTGRVVERMVVEREKARQGSKRSGNRSLVWCVGVLR